MRIKTYVKGGYSDGGFTSGGGTMTGPLILAADPTKDLEATTKQYVDTQTTSFDAGKFTAGVLQPGRLPVLTGDVTSNTGSNNILLATTGVSGGVFTKVTVNGKGLITAGGSLTEADLPNLDWGKITTGKPSTLAGYGITDALAKTGGTVTGSLTLSADPTTANHIVTKQYVDNSAGTFSALKVGDIISKLTASTPTGFLRCNGGDVSKTTYSALYAVVGDVFSNSFSTMVPGVGLPWQQQYQFNTTQGADLGSWASGPAGPSAIAQGQYVVTANRVYLLGGYVNGTGAGQSTIWTATINADGSLGAWANAGSLPAAPRDGRAVVANNNRVYLFVPLNGNTLSTLVYSAPINADGTLGAWVACTSTPVTLYDAQILVVGNYIYQLGGYNGGTSAAVYYTTINADGSLNAWTQGANLALSVYNSHLVVTSNRVYLVGGFNTTAGDAVTSIQTAVINTNGTLGAWTTASSVLPAAIQSGSVFVTKKTVYIMGGYTAGSTATSSVYYAPINADGTLGTWTTGTSLPVTSSYPALFATSTYLYLLGGYVNGSVSTANYFVRIAGSVSDYSSYYNGSITSVGAPAAGNFRLPDLTTNDGTGSYSYIKI